ncbi:MAG: hypothetical protein AB1640_13030 [bacterium]
MDAEEATHLVSLAAWWSPCRASFLWRITLLSDLSEKDKQSLDFLKADFNAIKAEIGRRSSLQKAVLLAYFAVLAFVFRADASGSFLVSRISALWLSAILAFLYYQREDLEIRRLGAIISEKIAISAERITSTPKECLLPSETDNYHPKYCRSAKVYYVIFQWLTFLVIPILLTVYLVSLDRLGECLR